MKKEIKEKLIRQFKVTRNERKKYPLPTGNDFLILTKCKLLEKKKLSKEDKFLVKLIKTQLQKDWRKPLLKVLNKLEKKYK